MAVAALENPLPFSFSVGILPRTKKKETPCNVYTNYGVSEKLAIRIRNKDIPQNSNTDYNAYISSLLRSCWGLGLLKQIHGNIVKSGLEDEISVEAKAKIIDLYGIFGDMGCARLFFNEMETSNRFVWNIMIRACANNAYFEETLELFRQMQCAGIEPNKFTFPFVIKACTGLLDLEQGREIHKLVVRDGLEADAYVGPALVNMYAKCGSIEDARQVFDKIPEKNLVLWASMISRYVGVGDGNSALGLFREMMHLKEIGLDFGCFAGGIRACGLIKALLQGRSIHARVIRSGFETESSVVRALLTMYGNCGSGYLNKLFDKAPHRELSIWDAMISSCAKNGHGLKALEIFFEMQKSGIEPSPFTFANVIPAFAHVGDLEKAKRIHKWVISRGFESNIYVGTALVDMYAKCGSLEVAREVFDKIPKRNLALWASMISRYVGVEDGKSALGLFREMTHLKETELDFGCFASGLMACGLIKALLQGKSMHARVIRSGFESESSVVCALLHMYGNCGSGYLNKLFDKVPYRDLSIWNAMISTCATNGHGLKALEIFFEMQKSGIEPSPFTFANVIPAFAHVGDLEQAKRIHKWVISRGFDSDIYVGTALVDMYAKCGSLEVAREMFDKMPRKNEATWMAMIAGYKINNQTDHARVLLNAMQKVRNKPNARTSVGLLSKVALADGDCQHFDEIAKEFSIDPSVKHYARKVDILGNAGRFEEACNLIRNMQLEDLASVWGILLGACKIHCNTELAERVADKLFKLEPRNPKWYKLLSDVYSAAGRMDGIAKVKKMMQERMVPNIPLRSILQIATMIWWKHLSEKIV